MSDKPRSVLGLILKVLHNKCAKQFLSVRIIKIFCFTFQTDRIFDGTKHVIIMLVKRNVDQQYQYQDYLSIFYMAVTFHGIVINSVRLTNELQTLILPTT